MPAPFRFSTICFVNLGESALFQILHTEWKLHRHVFNHSICSPEMQISVDCVQEEVWAAVPCVALRRTFHHADGLQQHLFSVLTKVVCLEVKALLYVERHCRGWEMLNASGQRTAQRSFCTPNLMYNSISLLSMSLAPLLFSDHQIRKGPQKWSGLAPPHARLFCLVLDSSRLAAADFSPWNRKPPPTPSTWWLACLFV